MSTSSLIWACIAIVISAAANVLLTDLVTRWAITVCVGGTCGYIAGRLEDYT